MSIKHIINQVSKRDKLSEQQLSKIFHKYPKSGSGLYKKSAILAEYKVFKEAGELKLGKVQEKNLLHNLKAKKVRTISGVTPVTVLTKPFPCPGKCIFCPNDVRMPKSYLRDEPGAQRAEKNKFDPYMQTYNRLIAYRDIGHPTDKVELIILGGTWSSYPEGYQIWFVKRCFDAMNDFDPATSDKPVDLKVNVPFDKSKLEEISGEDLKKTYNQVILLAIKRSEGKTATWKGLGKAHKINEAAKSRCVGLVIETRPDEITEEEVIRIRKLGGTKVQLGVQSLNDKVLSLNKRGHDVKTTRNAFKLLRQAGFKIHIHYMPNLYGSTPEEDIADYKKLFTDKDFRPDEIKIYPCSLIASAELMQYYKKGLWKPYTEEELLHVLQECIKNTPAYCRITRMIRDISSDDIVTGNKKTNFRQIVESKLKLDHFKPLEIRSREVKGQKVLAKDLKLDIITYETSTATEKFLQYITDDNKIAGFLRLSLPKNRKYHFIKELEGSAIIREVHVYGPSLDIGKRSRSKPQHIGLGKNMIEKAKEISKAAAYKNLAVISSVGTREYYKKLGFNKYSELYQVGPIIDYRIVDQTKRTR